MRNKVGRESSNHLALVWYNGNRWLFAIWTISVSASTAELIGDYFYNRQQVTNYYQKSMNHWTDPFSNILAVWLFISWIGNRDINKWGFEDFFRVRLSSPIHKEYSMCQCIGTVIIERHIFSSPCPLLIKSPNNLARLETEIKFWQEKYSSNWK
jgi:hypothetical protein